SIVALGFAAMGVGAFLGLAGCSKGEEKPAGFEELKEKAQKSPEKAPASVAIDKGLLAAFAPTPEVFGEDLPEAQVALGRTLFHETRLSKGQDISCNTCHVLENYGVDGKPTSAGHKGLLGARNSPTVYGAAGHFVQFWDGRAKDVE